MNDAASPTTAGQRACLQCGAPYSLWSWQRSLGSGLCTVCSKANAKLAQKPIWEREITTRQDALNVVRVTAFCYFGLALLDFIIARFDEPLLNFTAVVIVVCGLLIWFLHSRVAALVLLVLFLCDVGVLIFNVVEDPKHRPAYIAYPLLLLQWQVTIQAVRATFALNRQFKEHLAHRAPVPASLSAFRADSSLRTEQASQEIEHVTPTPAHAGLLSTLPRPSIPERVHVDVPPASLPAEAAIPLQADSWVSTIRRKLRRILSAIKVVGVIVFSSVTRRKDGDAAVGGPLWSPLGAAAYSLVLTPLFGSALMYLNWSRLARPRRARIAALWFWGSAGWLLFFVATPAAWHPPLWAYLVFLGAWFGLVAYPQHLSLQNRFATGYRRATWTPAIAVGSGCLLLLMLVHAATNRLYQPSLAKPDRVAVAGEVAPVEDRANHLFSAEEITSHYRDRILEIGVTWKESSGFVDWLLSKQHPAGSQGSGIILANDPTMGLVVTNYHVVAAPDSTTEGSYRCAVRQDSSQEYTEATCIARAKPPLDLALLIIKLNRESWSADVVPIQAIDNLHQGESVVAIGNALGEGISTTNGVISHFDALDSQGRGCIRTSAPISPGNSGGPLFTARGGFFAGITTATRTEERAQNYNMAIPAEYVLDPNNWDFANSEAREAAEVLLKAAADREHR